MKKTNVLKSVVVMLLGAYSVSIVADDGLTPGPGIFSGEKGQFSLSKALNKSSKEVKEQPSEEVLKSIESKVPSDSVGRQSAVSLSDNAAAKKAAKTELSEFQLYKEWRKFKADGSGDYNEFQQWLQYRSLLNSAK